MPGQPDTARRAAPPTAGLLVRDVAPVDQPQLLGRLLDLGWRVADLEAWAAGAHAVVLYDPVDDGVVGAALVVEVDEGCFELVRSEVAREADGDLLRRRLVGAAGDRARRCGGAWLLASATGAGLSDDRLADLGFRFDEAGRAGPRTREAGRTRHLEL